MSNHAAKLTFCLALAACQPKGGTNPARLAPVLVGELNSQNVGRFAKRICDLTDKVVGLKLSVPSEAEFASANDNRLIISSADEGGGKEVLIGTGWTLQHGNDVVDGFYVVKSGGEHQGVISCDLTATDEAALISNSSLHFDEERL